MKMRLKNILIEKLLAIVMILGAFLARAEYSILILVMNGFILIWLTLRHLNDEAWEEDENDGD